MINKKNVNTEWLEKVSKKYKINDKILVEKVIRALLLLEGLVQQEIFFVFKGGTALMLHFDSIKRLSIDIDIILPKEISNFDDKLNNIVQNQGFLRKDLQSRNVKMKIKKEHYKFFYTPIHKTNNNEEYVLLDVLFEEIHYSNILSIPIQSAFVPMNNEPLNVIAPSIEDLLGDKLTAFAPNTTGIPYFKGNDSMSMEIIKQLFDIGNLFDSVADIEVIKSTFARFAKTELAYRNEEFKTETDVLNDIYQTALCIVTRGADGEGNFEELQKGVQRIKGMIISENYQIEKAITHSSKAAYMAILIKNRALHIEKYNNKPLQMKDWIIINPFNTKLNKLKKSNPESFFYWYKIFEIDNK